MRTIILAALPLAASPALAVDFPIHADDLDPGERIHTKVHDTGGGPQTGAKDLRVLRRAANNNWQVLKQGKTDETVNANYLIYGRPFFAMAEGAVVGCWRNAPKTRRITIAPKSPPERARSSSAPIGQVLAFDARR
jgi:hypothetical protein